MKCVQQGRPCAKHAICIISPASRKNGWGQCNHHNFHFTNEDTESLWSCETPTLPVTWGWRPVWVPRSTCHIPSLSGHFPTFNCVLGLWRHIWSFLLDSTCLRGRKCLYVPFYSPCSTWHRTDSKSLLNEWSHSFRALLLRDESWAVSLHQFSAGSYFMELGFRRSHLMVAILSLHIHWVWFVLTPALSRGRMVRIFSQESRDLGAVSQLGWGAESVLSGSGLTTSS